MFVKAISVVGFVLLLKNIGANNCPRCGGEVKSRTIFGEDDGILSKVFSHPIIRPKPIQKPPYHLPLHGSVSKGPCFRRTAIVKPAITPRPIYIESECKAGVGTNDSELAAAAAKAAQMLTELTKYNCLNPAPPVSIGPALDIPKVYKQALAGAKPSVPADPVSLALAYQMYQDTFNKRISEDGLAYGFRKLPLEKIKSSQTCAPTVPEAGLYSINGEIVELMPVPAEEYFADSLSAEAMDELVDLACDSEINEGNFVKRPSLMDLGYTPAKRTKATFIDIPPLPVSTESDLPTAVASEIPAASDYSLPVAPSEISVESEVDVSQGSPTASELSESPEVAALQSTSALEFPETEEDHLPPTNPAEIQMEASEETPEPAEPLLPLPEGFKPEDVVYKDFADSEAEKESPTIGNESEEVVTQIPATTRGYTLDDLLEGIRTYTQSRLRSSSSGSRSSRRGSDVKKSS